MRYGKGVGHLLVALAMLLVVPAPADAGRRERANRRSAPETIEPATPPAATRVADALDTADSPSRGPDDAAVTIVVFSDFQCPYCLRLNQTLDSLVEEGGVRIVFKHMPLDMHRQALTASRYAWAAGQQGAFWAYHDGLWQLGTSGLSTEALVDLGNRLELDVDRLVTDAESAAAAAAVEADIALGHSLGIRGVPATYVNGISVSGAQPAEIFEDHIARERDTVAALLAEGRALDDIYAERVMRNLEAQPAPSNLPRRNPIPDPNEEMQVPVGDSAAIGPESALVTIVMFGGYQCPYCARVQAVLDEVFALYGDDVRLVYKHNPLSFHENSMPAALASVAAQNQGAFEEFHARLYAKPDQLSRATYLDYARELGLDLDRFAADMDASESRARVEADLALAERLVATGTPMFFIDGIRLRGAQPLAAFQDAIDAALRTARAELGDTPVAVPYDVLQADANAGSPTMIPPP